MEKFEAKVGQTVFDIGWEDHTGTILEVLEGDKVRVSWEPPIEEWDRTSQCWGPAEETVVSTSRLLNQAHKAALLEIENILDEATSKIKAVENQISMRDNPPEGVGDALMNLIYSVKGYLAWSPSSIGC